MNENFISASIKKGNIKATLVSLNEHAYVIRSILEKLSNDYGLGLDLNIYDFEGFAFLMLTDILSERLLYTGPSTVLDDELEATFPWYNRDGDTSESSQLICEIDDVNLGLNALLDDIIGSQTTWLMYNCIRIDKDSAAIVRSTDFRILDWERAVREKIIPLPERNKWQLSKIMSSTLQNCMEFLKRTMGLKKTSTTRLKPK